MIKNWLQSLLKKKQSTDSKEWRTEYSILQFLLANRSADGKLTPDAHDLPDDRPLESVKFAPGLMDAMFGADDGEDAGKRIDELAKHLKKIATEGDKKSEQLFFQLITANEAVIGIIDGFLNTIVQKSLPVEPYLFSYAKDLATKTNKRNGVKFGIAILGLCSNKSVLNDLHILGLHDEFTVYATIAIANLSDDPASELWTLARKVDGWGKIQLIDRLVKLELNEAMKDWLILEGYKNSIMYEYLAFTCATHGLLHDKLNKTRIDNNLFTAAAEIIDALINGGPAEDISEYIHAASVIERLIAHAKEHAIAIAHFVTLHRIKDFLLEIQTDIGQHKNNGWTQDIISNTLIDIMTILNGADWRALTHEGLKSNDNVIYWNAKKAAERLGIDLWETIWDKLQNNRMDHSAWYDVTYYAGSQHAQQIIDFALDNLPLEEYATGPEDVTGIGTQYAKFMCLDLAISFLENYPQKGERLVLTGLRSPVTRNRNMSLKVLEKWGRENWSIDIQQELNHLKNTEPNKDTKKNIEGLLRHI